MAFSTTIMGQFHFPEISLLITHYNRCSSLERLLLAFEKQNCTFGEIVVSDDGSRKEHLDTLIKASKRFQFKLIEAEKNSGLGNNINKGQDAVINKYTLYIQEDFVPTVDFPETLKVAFDHIINDKSLDIVRFYAYGMYPYLTKYDQSFSKMYLPFLGLKYTKLYQYSDHPHLRRSTFLTKFGRYKEGVKGDKTEYRMCVSFIRNKGNGLFYRDFKKLFVQENTEMEPSTMKRGYFRNANNILISVLRDMYRQVKNNYQIYFTRPLRNKY